MFARSCAACITLLLLSSASAAGQPGTAAAPSRSAKAPVVGAIVGAAAGFAAGLALGLAVYDESIDSERKIWLLTGTLTAGGAGAGYWLGRLASRPSPGRRGPLVPPRLSMEWVPPAGSLPLRAAPSAPVPAPPFQALFGAGGTRAGTSGRPVVPVARGYFRSE